MSVKNRLVVVVGEIQDGANVLESNVSFLIESSEEFAADIAKVFSDPNKKYKMRWISEPSKPQKPAPSVS